MTEFIRIAAIVMGVAMSLGYFSQALKIYREKSATNVSLLSYVVFAFGTLTWLIYGLSTSDKPIIWGFAFGVAGSWLVLALELVYRKKNRRRTGVTR